MGRGDRYLVFGLRSCPYCKMAVDMLESLGYDYQSFDLDSNPEYLSELKKFYEHRTVPMVLRFGVLDSIARFVGGFDDLKRELND